MIASSLKGRLKILHNIIFGSKINIVEAHDPHERVSNILRSL